jgi:hypothetical protein
MIPRQRSSAVILITAYRTDLNHLPVSVPLDPGPEFTPPLFYSQFN